MLGSLARWLRAFGLDADYHRDIEDDRLLELSAAQGRILLTKDRPLVRRATDAGLHVHLVEAEGLERQLVEILARHARDLDLERAHTRCIGCNVPLHPVEKEAARGHVPPYVHRTQNRFLHCPRCGKHYWAATHVEGMRGRIERVREELGRRD